MSRYIDADALPRHGQRGGIVHWKDIDDAPSIDICFCKECRYCKKKRGTFKGEPITFCRCEENNRDVESDDFCSYGERLE